MRLDAPVESEPSLGVAPLLDIVFLLLVFFMVTTSFATAELPLDLAEAESPASSPDPLEPLMVEISADGVAHVEGLQVDEVGLAEAIGARALAGETRIVVRADEATPHGAVVGVLDLARSGGLSDVSIAVDAPSSSQIISAR